MKAKTVLKSAIESGKNPAKIIFGSRKLFNKLKKSHLNGKRREKLKKEWKEKDSCYTPEEIKQKLVI